MNPLRLINIFKHRLVEFKISKLEKELWDIETGEQPDIIYRPDVNVTGRGVDIIIMTGNFSGLIPGYHVAPPNILESLLGITFEDKINNTYQKVKKRCDRLNNSYSYLKNSVEISGVNND